MRLAKRGSTPRQSKLVNTDEGKAERHYRSSRARSNPLLTVNFE